MGMPASPAEHRFARPYGLTDNPFAPRRLPPLNGAQPSVQNKFLLSNLHKQPLRLDKDPALDCLYVPEAGEFGRYQQEFQDMLELAGYGEDPVETVQQFAFLVCGEQGTGKSTLVNWLVRWLKQCRIPGEWHEWRYPPEPPDPQANQGLHHYLAEKLNAVSDGEYCCLVIDNLTTSNKHEAVRENGRGPITLRFFATILQKTLAESWPARRDDPGRVYEYRNNQLRSIYLRGTDPEELLARNDRLQELLEAGGPRWRLVLRRREHEGPSGP